MTKTRKTRKVNGQIFHITDGLPTNLDFLISRLKVALGQSGVSGRPKLVLPAIVLRLVAFAFFVISLALGKRFKLPSWGLTPMEVAKLTKSHYFSIAKARKYLSYKPVVNEKQWEEISASLLPLDRMQNCKTFPSQSKSSCRRHAPSFQGFSISASMWAVAEFLTFCCTVTVANLL